MKATKAVKISSEIASNIERSVCAKCRCLEVIKTRLSTKPYRFYCNKYGKRIDIEVKECIAQARRSAR